ncbi:MAG: hypothetical protein Q8P81_00655 [Nanoarchaeota archaeon]|nr:hypothetical protein [Nanoarchaeota archaeon]
MAEKKSSNQTLLDIVQGISQAMASSYDGALDEEGEPIKIGLKREVDNPITQCRTMDGFGCRIQGKFLVVSYHSEILMRDVHDKKRFEGDIEDAFTNVVKFLKKQYKAFTKNTLGLKEQGETKIKVESMSRIRSWVIAQKIYKISGAEELEVGDNEKLDKAIENWLSQKTDKKPKNVSIKKGDNDKEDK